MNKQTNNEKPSAAADKPAQVATAADTRLKAFNYWWAEHGDANGDNKAIERSAWFAGYQYGRQRGPAPMRVKHVPAHYALLTDSQDIRAALDSIDCETDAAAWVGCLFVDLRDGQYCNVYACERAIPYLEEPVFALL